MSGLSLPTPHQKATLFYICLHFQRLEDEYDEEQAEEDVGIFVITIMRPYSKFDEFK